MFARKMVNVKIVKFVFKCTIFAKLFILIHDKAKFVPKMNTKIYSTIYNCLHNC